MITNKDIDLEALGEYLDLVPFDVTRTTLYSARDLYDKFDSRCDESIEECYDTFVYRRYIETGKHAYSAKEQLARTLHDYCIDIAMDKFLAGYERTRVVGVMGGHSASRTDATYAQVALISKRLTEQGFLMTTGGGPGAMEATHLGAWMAGRTDHELTEAIEMLQVAPTFRDKGWLSSAFKVMERFPQTKYCSLGVPTWLYGHEPATPFATHIAKLFENSVREDSILTIAYGGIIYSPGSAGTVQEIFQDAVQNHYLSFGISSPMIFLGKEFWTEDMPIYPMLTHLSAQGKYKNLLLSISDDPDEIIGTLNKFQQSL